jgi:hypothetical protein
MLSTGTENETTLAIGASVPMTNDEPVGDVDWVLVLLRDDPPVHPAITIAAAVKESTAAGRNLNRILESIVIAPLCFCVLTGRVACERLQFKPWSRNDALLRFFPKRPWEILLPLGAIAPIHKQELIERDWHAEVCSFTQMKLNLSPVTYRGNTTTFQKLRNVMKIFVYLAIAFEIAQRMPHEAAKTITLVIGIYPYWDLSRNFNSQTHAHLRVWFRTRIERQ